MGLKPPPSSRQVVLRAGPWPLSEILEFFVLLLFYICVHLCVFWHVCGG